MVPTPPPTAAPMPASPQAVGLLLDPAHSAELTIKGEDTAHHLGLGRVDDGAARSRRSRAARYRPSTRPSFLSGLENPRKRLSFPSRWGRLRPIKPMA